MAGGGAFLTLPLLIALGLPPEVANGTIRVGVLFQNVGALVPFINKKALDWRLTAALVFPILVGALLGAELAVRLDAALLEPLFGAALIGWAVILLVRPGRFIAAAKQPRPLSWIAWVLAFLAGIYGGFMQAGVGFPLLAILVLYLGHNAVRANAIKVALVLAYTLVVLPRFAIEGLVAWTEGLILSFGMLAGGYTGARWQLRAGADIVRWFVLVMVLFSGAMLIYKSLAS